MTAPTLVSVIPDQQHGPSVAITPFDVSVYFTDQEAGDSVSYGFAGFPSGTGLSGNASTGAITGTPNSNDTADEFDVTVTVTDGNGNTQTLNVTFTPSGTPTAAATYYVKPYADGGRDNAAGTSSGTAWATPNKAVSVVEQGGGQTIVEFAPGEYELSGGFVVSNGGSSGNEVVWRVGADGDVVFTAPPGQYIGTMMTFADGLEYFDMLRTAARRFVVDGKVIFGFGGGEIQRGDDPTSVSRVRRAAQFNGVIDNCDIGFHVMRCSDWNGIADGRTGGTLILRLSSDQHGTPYLSADGQDKADTFSVNTSGTARTVITGGPNGYRIDRGGHGGGECRGGAFTLCNGAGNGIWGGFVDTWSAAIPEGNRAFTFTHKGARYCHMYDYVIDGSGKAGDQPLQEGTKCEGRDITIINTLHRRPHWNHIETARAGWSNYAYNIRVGHATFETSPGPVWELRDYGTWNNQTQSQANTPFGPFELVNCIMIEPATSNNRVIDCSIYSGTWSNQFRRMAGITVQCASRDFDDLTLRISGGGGPGEISFNTATASHGSVFSNFTLTTDANLDGLPASTADTDASDLISVLALDNADTNSLENGVNLTTVSSSDSGTGTSLIVNDARWFPNPADGVHAVNAFQQFEVNVNGTNRAYTAINYATNTLTMASSFSRSSGQPVNLRITSGTTPSRGYSHQ